MKIIKIALRWFLYFLLIPLSYLVIALLLSAITIERKSVQEPMDKSIFLGTNGVHLFIVLPKYNIDSALLSGLKHEQTDDYFSFSWGDENFYLNTPTWGDLTFSTAFRALFLKSSTLMHVTRYRHPRSDWIEIQVSESELIKLNAYILNAFQTTDNGHKIILENQGYTAMDDFYRAKGYYYFHKTCNSWVNTGFKKSGLRSCLWTPFDFALMGKYE